MAREPITVYFWPTPNGKKIAVALEEFAVPYRVQHVNIGKGEQFSSSFLAISPNNRIPAIVDPDGPGHMPMAIFESGAILLYLARKLGRFGGFGDPLQQSSVEQWLMWQVGGLGPMAGQNHHFRHFAPQTIGYGIERYTEETARLYGVLDRQLAGRDFICDEYSIADMACVGWVAAWERQGISLKEFANVAQWLARMLSRPAVQRAFAWGEVQLERPEGHQ